MKIGDHVIHVIKSISDLNHQATGFLNKNPLFQAAIFYCITAFVLYKLTTCLYSTVFFNKPQDQISDSSLHKKQIQPINPSVTKDKIYFIGARKLGLLEFNNKQSLPLRKDYYFEQIPIFFQHKDSQRLDKLHFKKNSLTPHINQWVLDKESGKTNLEFQPWLTKQLHNDYPTLNAYKEFRRTKTTWYFSEETRKQVEVHVNDQGELVLPKPFFGIDNAVYEKLAFVLTSSWDKKTQKIVEQLFIYPKNLYEQGKTSHISAVPPGDAVKAAGIIRFSEIADPDNPALVKNKIVLRNYSGHFEPHERVLDVLIDYLKKRNFDTSIIEKKPKTRPVAR